MLEGKQWQVVALIEGLAYSDAGASQLMEMDGTPQNKLLRTRASAMILDANRLLLIHRHKDGQEYYVLPGGGIEEGESPEEACLREVREETSLTVAIIRKLTEIDNAGSREHIFQCRRLYGSVQLGGSELNRQSATNHYALEWIEREDLKTIGLLPAQVKEICLHELAIQHKEKV